MCDNEADSFGPSTSTQRNEYLDFSKIPSDVTSEYEVETRRGKQLLEDLQKPFSAQLVSHLESKDFKGSIYSGDKLDLAKKVKETLEQAKLGNKVYFSLKSTFVMFSPFTFPSWLGVLVARTGLGQGQDRAADQLLCFCVCVL